MPSIFKMLQFFAVFLLIASTGVSRQPGVKTIRGTVVDASNGDSLPSANILIEGTYRGTVSNRDGRYRLTIPDSLLPARVTVRYLGYHSQTRTIGRESGEVQDFTLQPSILELGEITVTDEDPAAGIMREVIRRKREWRRRLDTWRAEAYTRQTLANDTSIVMIAESVSEAFWDKERGYREVLKSRRQTANMEAAQNFAGVSYLPNFYDDNVEIAGFEVMGVTHPDALQFYRFSLEEYRTIDERVVYQIAVEPARKLQPLFEGTIYVLDGEYALLEVRLRPNDVIRFPRPIREFDTYYEQQFNNFGRDFWLPVDMRIDGDIKIAMVGLEFPEIRFRQISLVNGYEVNVPLPDSLYEEDSLIAVDSTAAGAGSDSLFVSAIRSVPLSVDEEQAYASIDSTVTLEEAFRPSGFLARFVDDGGDEEGSDPGFLERLPGDLAPAFRFNRVDGFYIGLDYTISPADRLELGVNGGYSTGYDSWGYGGEFSVRLIQAEVLSLTTGMEYGAHTVPQFRSNIFTPAYTIIPNLLGEPDYFNYYRREGFRFDAELEFGQSDISAGIGFNTEKHRPLSRQTAYDILGRDQPHQFNPAVPEGQMNSADIAVGYNMDEGPTLGVSGVKRGRLEMEYADPSLGSDFQFIRYRAEIDWSFPTFYPRRFLSNALDLKLVAGTSAGEPPLQRLGVIDGSIDRFSPFGTLKTRQGDPYMGERYLMLNAEHNFRTVPFELVGLRWAVERNWGVILFGGAGTTRISESRRRQIMNRTGYEVPVTGGIHYEAGISLNGLFGLFRVDLARRLDEPAFLVNVGLARIF